MRRTVERSSRECCTTSARREPDRLRGYNNLTVPSLSGMLKRARELGYALNDNHITAGATSIGLPIISHYGQPFAAISVGAISIRMNAVRQKKVMAMLRREVRIMERVLNEATRA
jgi:DNA-binding IclR family transcriptional regulator